MIDNFTGYKNKNAAIWARGEDHVFKNMKLADNGIGYTHAFPGITPAAPPSPRRSSTPCSWARPTTSATP
ncbi:MAG: hypothetical protein WDN45_02250 [Caulobacteraceae bacterium]